MIITTVGLKAVLGHVGARADVGAASNLSLTTATILTAYSIENVACELEIQEHDVTTWTAAQDVAGLVVSDAAAPNPVIHPAVSVHTSRVRWRNPTAGALWIYAYGWKLE